MALSLIASYSSDNSDSSDDSDDGISVVIHKNPQHAAYKRQQATPNRNAKNDNNKTKKRSVSLSGGTHARTRVKLQKTESVLDNVHRPELEEKSESIPLPSTVLTMFDKTQEQEELDQAQYQGRVRSFPHEKNNWASFIYVDVSDLELDEIRNFLLTEIEVELTEDVHVSLSRTVSLRHHWIDPVIQGITNGVKDIDRFTIKLDKLQVYCNDERTRTFIGLQATTGVKQLTKLTQVVNSVFHEYSLPKFYNPPKFHVSLVWCLGDKTKEISAILPALEMKMLDLIEDVDDFGKVFIKMAHCKSGNRFFDFKLK
jgi:hypothetical protein